MKASIYGDSLLRFVLFENGEYHSNKEFQRLFEQTQGITIENHSYFGSTVLKGLERLKRDINKGKELGEWCVWEFGANDSDYDWKAVSERPDEKHGSFTEEETFIRSVKEGLSLIRGAGARPLLVNLPPIVSERYVDWITRRGLSRENILRSIGGITEIDKTEARYSELIEKIAAEEEVPLVNIRKCFLMRENWKSLFCVDGVHPNRDGQKLIYEAFSRFAESRRTK